MRMAGLFGGLIIDDSLASTEQLRQYVRSIKHFAGAARGNDVEVEFENHIMFDGTFEKMQALVTRRTGAPNPFVVGENGYQGFLRVARECAQATLADRSH
jgi:hypothetical protein